MTITQTVDITNSRRLHLDVELPLEIPAGKAQIELKVIPFARKKENQEEILLTRQMIDNMLQASPHTQALTVILSTDMTIQEIREERTAKYL